MDIDRPPWWKTVLRASGLLALLASWWLGDGGWLLLAAGSAWIGGSEYALRFFADRAGSPYAWMLLSPLLLVHFSSVADFRVRLACFLMLVYIPVLAWRRGGSRIQISLAGMGGWRLWILSASVFALAATVFYARGVHLSGDEPHYLMIAQSLVEDGDFDLKNNVREKTYLSYLPVEIRFHGMVRRGKSLSFHMPGLSLLLVPFYFFFKLLGGLVPGHLFFRLAAALFNAFFAVGLFYILKNALPNKDHSALFLFFLATFPLVFQAVHLFPELPAATLLIFAYLAVSGPRQKYFLAGLLLACIPWFHLKYVIPVLVLTVFIVARICRRHRGLHERFRRLAVLFAAPLLSLLLLAFYSKTLYGSFDPGSISPEGNFFAIALGWKIETLLSFFLDQRDGLVVYAPVFLLSFLVFKKEIRTAIRDFALLAVIFFSYVLFHAFTTVRGGYSPAARPTLFVVWIMAVFLAAYVHHGAPGSRKILFRFAAGFTVFASLWLFYYPLFVYQPVTREISQRASSLLQFMSSSVISIPSGFPSYLKKPNAAYLTNWIWLCVLAAAIGLYYAGAWRRHLAGRARLVYPLLVAGLLFLFCFIPHVQLQTRYTAAGLSFFCNSKNFTWRQDLGAFKALAGQDYDLFVDLQGSAAAAIDMQIVNGAGAAVTVKNGRTTLLAETRAAAKRIRLRLPDLKKFRLGKKTLIHLGLETAAQESNAFLLLRFK